MLVKFTTAAYADITICGDVGISMLTMMGHSGILPSAILADAVPATLDRLTRAIVAASITTSATNINSVAPPVNMTNRALPLIALLTAAAKANANVVLK